MGKKITFYSIQNYESCIHLGENFFLFSLYLTCVYWSFLNTYACSVRFTESNGNTSYQQGSPYRFRMTRKTLRRVNAIFPLVQRHCHRYRYGLIADERAVSRSIRFRQQGKPVVTAFVCRRNIRSASFTSDRPLMSSPSPCPMNVQKIRSVISSTPLPFKCLMPQWRSDVTSSFSFFHAQSSNTDLLLLLKDLCRAWIRCDSVFNKEQQGDCPGATFWIWISAIHKNFIVI